MDRRLRQPWLIVAGSLSLVAILAGWRLAGSFTETGASQETSSAANGASAANASSEASRVGYPPELLKVPAEIRPVQFAFGPELTSPQVAPPSTSPELAELPPSPEWGTEQGTAEGGTPHTFQPEHSVIVPGPLDSPAILSRLPAIYPEASAPAAVQRDAPPGFARDSVPPTLDKVWPSPTAGSSLPEPVSPEAENLPANIPVSVPADDAANSTTGAEGGSYLSSDRPGLDRNVIDPQIGEDSPTAGSIPGGGEPAFNSPIQDPRLPAESYGNVLPAPAPAGEPIRSPDYSPSNTSPSPGPSGSSPHAYPTPLDRIQNWQEAFSGDLPYDPRRESTPASAVPSRGTVKVAPAVAQRAQEAVDHGFSLAERGAFFSARADFILALRGVTQALDAQGGGQRYSRCLSEGIVALKEADDFAPGGSRLEADLDLPAIVASHRTPVLKDRAPSEITPLGALQAYYTFAQERLSLACGAEPAAAQALFGLAKLQLRLANPADAERLNGPKAMALNQAALMVDPNNFMAANELGVLLARYGQFAAARQALLHSLKIAPTAEAWHNLAVVHNSLGERELAEMALNEYRMSSQTPSPSPVRPASVEWVHPSAFQDRGP